jgi:hypothetical protein
MQKLIQKYVNFILWEISILINTHFALSECYNINDLVTDCAIPFPAHASVKYCHEKCMADNKKYCDSSRQK